MRLVCIVSSPGAHIDESKFCAGIFGLDGHDALIIFRSHFEFLFVTVIGSIAIITGDVGVFIVVVKIHTEAAGAVQNFAVLAHVLAIEREHFVRRIIAFIFQGDHLQAEERTGNIHVGAVMTIIVVVTFGDARAGISREASILHIRSAFFHAERAKWRLDIDIIFFPIALIVRSDGATCERDKTNETQHCLD